MNLRERAQRDTHAILTDSAHGFGWDIILTAPDGKACELTGYSNDIAIAIDPQTGEVVSGRTASIVVSQQELLCKNVEYPKGVVDASKKPWLVEFKDINGAQHIFKIRQSNPDRTIGFTSFILELYRD